MLLSDISMQHFVHHFVVRRSFCVRVVIAQRLPVALIILYFLMNASRTACSNDRYRCTHCCCRLHRFLVMCLPLSTPKYPAVRFVGNRVYTGNRFHLPVECFIAISEGVDKKKKKKNQTSNQAALYEYQISRANRCLWLWTQFNFLQLWWH